MTGDRSTGAGRFAEWPPRGRAAQRPSGEASAPRPTTSTTPPWYIRRTAGAAQGKGQGNDLNREVMQQAITEVRQLLADRVDTGVSPDEAMSLIESEVHSWVRERGVAAGLPSLTPGMAARLAKAVHDDLFGLGALQPLLDDSTVEDIDINGYDEVWVSYADGRKLRGPAAASSDAELEEKIRYWARLGNTPREFSMANPLLNAALGEHGGIRLSAVMSVTPRPHVSIRRHRLVEVTLDDLVRTGTIDRTAKEFLSAAVRARKNIVVTGATKAGKTTMLRALISEVDPDERIATLESDYELYLHHLEKHRDVIPFEARRANSEGVGAITLRDLIPQALRHNPQRIIVGEVRADEIIPMLEAMNSGHEGSLCTIHANRGEEIFNRVLLLADRGQLAISPASIHMFVGMALDFVVHVHRDRRTNQRFVSEIIEVLEPGETDRPAVNHVFRPGSDRRAMPATTPRCINELVDYGFDPQLLNHRVSPWGEQQAGGYS